MHARAHPIRYFLSTPRDDRSRPGEEQSLLVCVTGADGDCRAMAERFQKARGESPFLIVCPCTFSNVNRVSGDLLSRYRQWYGDDEIEQASGFGLIPDLERRLDWDEAGLLAILDDLAETHGVARRVYLTGFSGGGQLVYRMIVRHPDRLAAAIPVCPNFNIWSHDYRSEIGTFAPDDKSLPVRVLTGGRDPFRHYRYGGSYLPAPLVSALLVAGLSACVGMAVWRMTRKVKRTAAVVTVGIVVSLLFLAAGWTGIEAQTDAAVGLLKELGYSQVEWTEVPDMGHDSASEQVIAAFAQRLGASPELEDLLKHFEDGCRIKGR